MKRKEFVKKICLAGIAGALGVPLISSCSSLARLYTADSPINEGILTIPLDAFINRGKNLDYIVITHKQLMFPICVYRFSDLEFSALWMECTHQGAELQVFGNKLECPAHGSEFDNHGNVENGPADENLKKFPVQVFEKTIQINLS